MSRIHNILRGRAALSLSYQLINLLKCENGNSKRVRAPPVIKITLWEGFWFVINFHRALIYQKRLGRGENGGFQPNSGDKYSIR